MGRIIWTATIILFLACTLGASPANGQPTVDPCVPTPTTLCLNNNRFQVEVDWFTDTGNSSTVGDYAGGGLARNKPISDVWTAMWFFDPDNLDLLIHLFQGCGNNNNYWVFAAGLTNVEVTLTVTDTQTGQEKKFFNPLGMPFQPITDTEAFATCPKSFTPLRPDPKAEAQSRPVERIQGACVENGTTVCLHDGRFELSMRAFGADQQAQRLADGTAGFLFGNPSFFDVFVSVIDGSSANGNYWMNYSLFPDTGSFTLTVTDTVKGGTRSYQHGPGDPLFVLDKTAFDGDEVIAVDGTLSGSWFATERDGEGFIFDIAQVNGVPTLVLYYFTFENNTSGRQAWLVGSAPVIGNKASVPVIIAEGAQFGTAFNPGDVNRIDWGNIKVTFLSCDRVLVESDSTLFPALRYEAGRLTPAPVGVQGVCQASGKSGPWIEQSKGTAIDGGYSGSWYRVERDGEGFIFNIAEIGGVNM